MKENINIGRGKNQEKEILELIYRLLDIENHEHAMNEVVRNAPALIHCAGCSIYLIPELVREFDGTLIDENGDTGKHSDIDGDIIVLAASSRDPDSENHIGKFYYIKGEGLTGWVFQHQHELLVDNLSCIDQFADAKRPIWKNKYKGAEYYFNLQEDDNPKPFLAAPLITERGKCYGVIRAAKFETGEVFPEDAKETFRSFSKVISRRLELEDLIHEQQAATARLIGLGKTINNSPRIFKPIVEEAQNLVGASFCNFYMLDNVGQTVQLKATTDPYTDDLRKTLIRDKCRSERSLYYHRGQGLIGWVFKTGLPLLVKDIKKFQDKWENVRLEDEALLEFSSSINVNEKDRCLCLSEEEMTYWRGQYTQLLAIPVKTKGKKTLGVIALLFSDECRELSRNSLRVLQCFSNNVSLLLEYRKQLKLKNTLILAGHKTGQELFQYVVEQLPRFVLAHGCSIFLKHSESDIFRLMHTSSAKLMTNQKTKKVLEIVYKPGHGKTGFVAQSGRTLVINHYGEGEFDKKRLQNDFDKYDKSNKYKLMNRVGLLNDKSGGTVGLARIIRNEGDPDFNEMDTENLKTFILNTKYFEKGLKCNQDNSLCEEGISGFTNSFLAIPLKNAQREVFGVIRIPRSFHGGVFTDEDIALVEAFGTRICSIIERERNKKAREFFLEKNLETLSKLTAQINYSFESEDKNTFYKNILEAMTNTLGFHFATIQMIDNKQLFIETIRGKRKDDSPDDVDPECWVGAKHPLNPPDGVKLDIHVLVLRSKKELIVKGWHPNFDEDIYIKCKHDKVIRAYIPIIAKNPDEEIGTLEAGYIISHQNTIDETEIIMLKAFADQVAIANRNWNKKSRLSNK